jgi:anti-sigma B factor antagonist
MPSVGQLLMHRTRDGTRQTLVLGGELDLVTAPDLEDTVAALCLEGAEQLVLDLRDVVFMDSSGLRTVLASLDMCRLHECELLVIPGTGACRRLFELTGADEDLPLREPDELVEPPA